MPVVKTDLEHRLWCALKRIISYDSASRILQNAEKTWGLEGHEALEMAYENIQQEAKTGIYGVRARKNSPHV